MYFIYYIISVYLPFTNYVYILRNKRFSERCSGMLRRVDWQIDTDVSMMTDTVNLSVKHSKEHSSTASICEGNSLHGLTSLKIRIFMFVYFVALFVCFCFTYL